MAKQLLIYGSVHPVTQKRHHDWSVKAGDDFEFARNINSAPLMAAEFPNAASEHTIVFTGDDKIVMPVIIMGFREAENLYLNKQGKWSARYVPAFLRRYPFVFSSNDNGKSFTLCIDEEFSGCNQQGRGERLFDAQGEQTQYLKNVLEFLKEYQVHYKRTEAFSKKLRELDLLEPMTAQFKTPDGVTGNLTGFMAVNRERVKKLSGEQLTRLVSTDELELIYIHIHSLQNFNQVLAKYRMGTEDAGPADGESTKSPGKSPQNPQKKVLKKKKVVKK